MKLNQNRIISPLDRYLSKSWCRNICYFLSYGVHIAHGWVTRACTRTHARAHARTHAHARAHTRTHTRTHAHTHGGGVNEIDALT